VSGIRRGNFRIEHPKRYSRGRYFYFVKK
jgi:hypothetical protein